MPANDKVFLHYTQAELNRNFDQRAWDPDSMRYIGRYASASAAARMVLTYKTYSYGEDPEEVLDVFFASKNSPTILFIHGGAWRNFDKSDFSYLAPEFVRAGFNFVVVNFSKLPGRRLPDVVGQLRRAVSWLHQHKSEYGGSASSLHICAHSSGAHLSAVLLTTHWPEVGCPPNVIGGASLISGSYDLQPALLSKRGAYISVTEDERRELSPMFLTDRIGCPVFVAYAEKDTDEFRRQSEEFSQALDRSGKLVGRALISGIGHFAILDELCRAGSRLLIIVFSHALKSTKSDSLVEG